MVIRKNLLQLIFSGAYLWRWNDKLRPVELAEIEKQAHKMLVACALWQENSRTLGRRERILLGIRIIEGALFDYFYRLIITDIKPPVFYRIKENREHYRSLTAYTLSRLAPVLAPLGQFWEKMRRWHLREDADGELDRRILAASHLFASQWEFKLIRPHNYFDDEMEGIGRSFEMSLASFGDLPGMAHLLDSGNALGKFANLCGQLRFQIRWAQAPRIPATSVLGHMFIVAVCSYFFSLVLGASDSRIINNFYGGLFHDFPELLTRDIITPVKKSFSGLSELIREYEEAELERRILKPLRDAGFHSLVERMLWYLGLETGSEFQDCCRVNGEIIRLSGMAELALHDREENDPKDGELLKICDLLAAFLEADSSIRNGIASSHLLEARARLKAQLMDSEEAGIGLRALLADFD